MDLVNEWLFIRYAYIGWWWTNSKNLSPKAYETIYYAKKNIYVSSATIWEMSIKHYKGKFPEVAPIIANLDFLMKESKFLHLHIDYRHGILAGQLPQKHADPFDRMLVAQTMSENLTLISKDEKLQDFNVDILW